jgi:hypothetical protein
LTKVRSLYIERGRPFEGDSGAFFLSLSLSLQELFMRVLTCTLPLRELKLSQGLHLFSLTSYKYANLSIGVSSAPAGDILTSPYFAGATFSQFNYTVTVRVVGPLRKTT